MSKKLTGKKTFISLFYFLFTANLPELNTTELDLLEEEMSRLEDQFEMANISRQVSAWMINVLTEREEVTSQCRRSDY